MTSKLHIVDVTDVPELRAIADEVRRTGEPHVLQADGDNLAIISPTRKTGRRRQRSRTPEDRAAFRASAGGWKDLVDTDALQAAIRESRDHSNCIH